MTAKGSGFGGPMEAVSEIRPIRTWRILLAHDASAPTCDALAGSVEGVLGSIDLYDASSLEDARASLASVNFHICLVCLDLPPVPTAGARLAQEALDHNVPVVLVTRSLRWLPAAAADLRALPWISPDASSADVAKALGLAVDTLADHVQRGRRVSMPSWHDIEAPAPISAGALR